MKKILIFGATGNIGAYFVDYCHSYINKDEFEIIPIGRKSTTFFEKYGMNYIQLDVCNENDFRKLPTENVYAIINLVGILPAYLKEYNPYTYVETNILGSLRILEFARKNNVDRVLYTQTWAELAGYWGKETVLKPGMKRNLLYTGDHAFYSITKSMIVDTMEYYKQEYGIKNFVFRLPNIYMYHPDTHYYVDGNKKIVAYRYMIDRAAEGKPIEMWGNPNAYKDIIYVKDLCQMMFKAIFANVQGGIYHAGTGIKTTLKEQIEGMINVFSPINNKSEIVHIPGDDSFTSFVMDIENARNDLGYEPKYTYIKYLEDYKKEQRLKRFNTLYND